jgi:hypothetical protein
MGGERFAYKIVVEKIKINSLLGRRVCRWYDNSLRNGTYGKRR